MKQNTREDYASRILRVQLYIQERLDDPISLETLARQAYFSPYHFHRIFKSMIGESVAEYVRRLMLERAAQWLARNDRSVTDIAFSSGYENHESFSRAFKIMFNMSPSEYRSKFKGNRKIGTGVLICNNNPEIRKQQKGAVQMEVRIETLEPKKVAFVRHIGPYEKCEPAWNTLCSYAGQK